ncbi:MAG: serine/threonine-protein phosphatase, partial [Armatimonadetes bacterium]|nr:serine/threonine-protein phosphatase [Armatimonadota bacterium]
VSRGEDRPELALARLADELLATDEPWSAELGELLAALQQGETSPLLAAPPLATVTTTSGTANDAGPFRAGNEDSALQVRYQLTAEPGGEELELVAVADGVGGHRAGAMASRLALSTFASSLLMSQAVALLDLAPLGEAGNRAVSECLRRAFLAADETVSALGTEDEETPPGTTLVVALRLGRRLFIGNVGDSRAYLLRGEQLQRLTRDDSVVQRLIEQGELSVEESYGHPLSYAVTQCLGRGPSNLKPALSLRLLNDWDRLVLCTDGVTEVLRDTELAALLRQHDEPQAAAEALVAAARTMGGRDNMTALVMNVRMS